MLFNVHVSRSMEHSYWTLLKGSSNFAIEIRKRNDFELNRLAGEVDHICIQHENAMKKQRQCLYGQQHTLGKSVSPCFIWDSSRANSLNAHCGIQRIHFFLSNILPFYNLNRLNLLWNLEKRRCKCVNWWRKNSQIRSHLCVKIFNVLHVCV